MRNERVDQTVRPTSLVDETYVPLLGDAPVSWDSRLHFLKSVA